jgi:hypothetical protein
MNNGATDTLIIIEAGPSSYTLRTDPPVHLRVTGEDVFGNNLETGEPSESARGS